MRIDGEISRGYSLEIGERDGGRGRILGRLEGNMSRARGEKWEVKFTREEQEENRIKGEGTEMRGAKDREDKDAKESRRVARRDYRNIGNPRAREENEEIG